MKRDFTNIERLRTLCYYDGPIISTFLCEGQLFLEYLGEDDREAQCEIWTYMALTSLNIADMLDEVVDIRTVCQRATEYYKVKTARGSILSVETVTFDDIEQYVPDASVYWNGNK